jgi:hypothetical protein
VLSVSRNPQTKANDPTGARAFEPPAARPPEDLAHLAARLQVLRDAGVGAYRGPDGETINFFPASGEPLTPDQIAAAREDNEAKNQAAHEARATAAAGGMRARDPLSAEMKRMLELKRR